MRFAQEISIFNPHAIEMAVVALGTQITQTAEEIRLEAARTLTNYSTTVQMNAAISAKANEITSEVSETYATNSSLNSLSSRIRQTATEISFTLSGGGTGTNAKKASLSITYTKEDGSKINLSAQTITFDGLVAFTNLSGSNRGSTIINGENISTGKIHDANNNTVFDLSAGTLTIKKGSINLGSGKFTVTDAGALTATSGTIGGFTISNDSLSGGKLIATGGSTRGDVVIGGGQVHVPYLRFVKNGNDIGGILTDYTWDDNPSGMRLWTGHGLHVTAEGEEWFTCDTAARFTGGVWNNNTQMWFSSDRRIKEDIKPLDGYKTIMGLNPVSFRYKESPDSKHHGFIAQEVQDIVRDDWNVVGTDGNILYLSYTELIADLVATVQAQDKRIKALEGGQKNG